MFHQNMSCENKEVLHICHKRPIHPLDALLCLVLSFCRGPEKRKLLFKRCLSATAFTVYTCSGTVASTCK